MERRIFCASTVVTNKSQGGKRNPVGPVEIGAQKGLLYATLHCPSCGNAELSRSRLQNQCLCVSFHLLRPALHSLPPNTKGFKAPDAGPVPLISATLHLPWLSRKVASH